LSKNTWYEGKSVLVIHPPRVRFEKLIVALRPYFIEGAVLLSMGFVADPLMVTVTTRPFTVALPVKSDASAFPTSLPRKYVLPVSDETLEVVPRPPSVKPIVEVVRNALDGAFVKP